MSPERTQAYRRVMRTLGELGPRKLLGPEQDRVRHAADNLVFSSDLGDDTTREALRDSEELCESLVLSERWEPVTAQRLERDLRACGPGAGDDIAAAA